ncbi:hypothetical protein [Legionella sp. WA2022007384]
MMSCVVPWFICRLLSPSTEAAEVNGHIRGTDIMTNKAYGGFIPYSAHVE